MVYNGNYKFNRMSGFLSQKSKDRYSRMDFLGASSLGLVLVISTAFGLGIGLYLDRITAKTPVFTIVFLILGIGAGFWQIVKEIIKVDASSKRKNAP